MAKRKGKESFEPRATAFAAETELGSGRRSARLRLRAAWMYYVEEMTQNVIADRLGIGRVTVVRLLNDARSLHEVRVSVSRDLAELLELEFALQQAFGLKEAIVAPLSARDADPSVPIGAVTGEYVSKLLRNDMRIGLGWGRTLINALPFVSERPVANLSVISLLGGITKTKQYNPSEFAWQFARFFQADCYLIAAPALVDSIETKRALIERCGLKDILHLARSLDAVVVGAGGMSSDDTIFRFGFVGERERRSLTAKGAVGDLLCHYYDRQGRLVDHPINEAVMAVPIETLTKAKSRILASGGPHKTEAILGAIAALRPTVFITDEGTAKALLAGVKG
ncbi:MAG: sugar-binding transcriptional regulator [Hyphomicrobiales bacterium]|nr:sugar-binding transcriptional regulator [Hyphomicrobiales bacterium]MBV9136101.1 sugar-binding transcriptional regulator [Hyphomicrobiales bacterium]MBV9591124.1 sugar-binding transcriptional regulator [Hyphomicrobiales bacterium]MBV9975834.1 sugar-binding transcriptional regulator [Hyphomicrobiales bacterium]